MRAQKISESVCAFLHSGILGREEGVKRSVCWVVVDVEQKGRCCMILDWCMTLHLPILILSGAMRTPSIQYRDESISLYFYSSSIKSSKFEFPPAYFLSRSLSPRAGVVSLHTWPKWGLSWHGKTITAAGKYLSLWIPNTNFSMWVAPLNLNRWRFDVPLWGLTGCDVLKI